MGKLQYPHLFEPIKIGNVTFKNRLFCAPTGYLNVHGDGYFTPGAEYYYARRALGGAASVATCEFFVGDEARSFDKQMSLDTPNIDTELARLAHAIDANGAVPNMELQHAGMYAARAMNDGNMASTEEDTGSKTSDVAYGPVEMECKGRVTRHILPMTDEMIEHTIDKYVRGAVMGKNAGFRMVLVHAGHGWFLHQFLSPIINTRTDKWGGSVENRCRILNCIIDGIHKACGNDFPVEVRISASELYDGGFGFDVGLANAIEISKHCNLIHASSGNHEVPEVFTKTHPSMFEPDGCEVQFSAEIKKHVNVPVGTVGALSDPDLMEEILASGKADVIEMAREFICEPDFPNLVRSGRGNDAKQCLRCLHCFAKEMQNGEPYCAINPQSGREMEAYYQSPIPTREKRILIVGGGVAGMEAALQCAKRGHEVVLCEKEKRLGGVMRCEEQIDFKHKFAYYLDQQQRKCLENPRIDV
ncbi:MAG: FAD-dependent oxidoreductase, partial [Coriobacteriales bacterium]